MFVYYLASQIPELVKSYGLLYAQPMIGWLNYSLSNEDANFVSLHGRHDRYLPPAGGLDMYQDWMYESLKSMMYVNGLV